MKKKQSGFTRTTFLRIAERVDSQDLGATYSEVARPVFASKKSRGFTLIELLVVIAIIGILSTVVFANIQSSRAKAGNASVKSGLRSIFPAALLVYDKLQTYSSICSDTDIRKTYVSAGIAGGGTEGVCNNSSTAWAVQSPLRPVDAGTTAYWCVDSTGVSRGSDTPLGGSRVCP